MDASQKAVVDRSLIMTKREETFEIDTNYPYKLNAGTSGVSVTKVPVSGSYLCSGMDAEERRVVSEGLDETVLDADSRRWPSRDGLKLGGAEPWNATGCIARGPLGISGFDIVSIPCMRG